MHSRTYRPRHTLAERINEIISKYETCPCSVPPKSSVPKIFGSPCLRGSSCNATPCPSCPPCLPCPAITSSSCCPQPKIITQPSPGPGLSRYISRRDLCPALRGCLSLYKRPATSHNQPSCCRSICPSAPQPTSSIGCPRSRPSCAIVNQNSRPLICTNLKTPATSSFLGSYCAKCKPCVKCSQGSSSPQSISKSCCPWSENSCITRQRISQQSCSPRCAPCSACCCSNNSETVRTRCTTPCCYSCTASSELSSSTPGTCRTSGSSRPARKRLTVFDDPPYTSNILEREFSSRFIRLDPCYCETDSSSSLDNSNIGNKCR